MAKNKKTNAMRILDKHKINYQFYEYEVYEGKTDGVTVAKSIGKDPVNVFKTLVTQGSSKEYYVFVVPVEMELNLKKAAKASGEKKIEMIPMKNLLALTGYIHGGCSPIGMKKQFRTFIHASVSNHETMICSGGKRGIQIELGVKDMIDLIGADVEEIGD